MTIQQIREMRNDKARELRNHYDNNKHAWGGKDGENQKRYETLADQIGDLDLRIENEERSLNIEAATKLGQSERAAAAGLSLDESVEGERAALLAFMRGGYEGLNASQREMAAKREREFRATMSTTTPSQGGYTVPRLLAASLIEAMKTYGGMREVSTVISTDTGATLDYSTTDATAEVGEIVAENATVASADPTFGIKTIGSFKYSSKDVTVPFELLQDTSINLEAHINARLAVRIARILNQHLTTGTGTGQPEGIVTAATLGKTGATGQTVTIKFDDFVDLEHAVDPAYRQLGKCRYMFHDSTLKAVKKLVDGQQRPLWLPSIAGGAPSTINGYQYTINQDMAVMAANAKSVLFGDFSFYTLRDVMAVQLFRMTDSAFTRKGQVGFLAFSRHDGKLIDVGGAVKYYANSAT